MDFNVLRYLQFVCHRTNSVQYLVGAKELVCKLWKRSTGNLGLSVGLQFEQYLITYSKLSVCPVLICLHLHPILSLFYSLLEKLETFFPMSDNFCYYLRCICSRYWTRAQVWFITIQSFERRAAQSTVERRIIP